MARNEAGQWWIEFRLGGGGSGGAGEVLGTATRELWPPAGEGFEEAVKELSWQLEQLRGASQAQAEAVSENTAAVIENTAAQARSGGESRLATAGRTAASVLASGLGLSPLLRGLVGLFGGGRQESAPVLTPYAWPPSIRFEGEIRRGQSGGPSGSGGWEPERDAGLRGASGPVNITVQVQAMDSRSFLDHSEEIARAVREAMLHSHALNDVVSEL